MESTGSASSVCEMIAVARLQVKSFVASTVLGEFVTIFRVSAQIITVTHTGVKGSWPSLAIYDTTRYELYELALHMTYTK